MIFDVGGDDTGAGSSRAVCALIRPVPCADPCGAGGQLHASPDANARRTWRSWRRGIAARGRLCIDSLVNNTNLAAETTPEMLREGHRVIAAAAALCGVSQVETCAQAEILAQCPELPNPMPLRRYMAPEWMEDA